MEPPERGTLVHAILEEYLLERLAGAPRSLPRLLAIAETQFAAAEARGLVGKPLLWRMDKAAIRRDLERFHDEEGDLEPLAAELEFGTGAEGADPAVTVTLEDGLEVRFKGKADRVDRARSGELVVSDYKTGRQTMLSGRSRRTPWPAAGSSSSRSTPWRRRRASAGTTSCGPGTGSCRRSAWRRATASPSPTKSRPASVDVLGADRRRRGGRRLPRGPHREARATVSSTPAGSVTSTSCARWPGTGNGRARATPPSVAPVLALMDAEPPDELEGRSSTGSTTTREARR